VVKLLGIVYGTTQLSR